MRLERYQNLNPVAAIECRDCNTPAGKNCPTSPRNHGIRNYDYGRIATYSHDWWYSRITQGWIKERYDLRKLHQRQS